VQGGSGCEPEPLRPLVSSPGRWAAVTGARQVLAGADLAVSAAAAAGARVLVLADRDGADARRAAALLAATGARVRPVDGADLAAAEMAAREASLSGGALVALSRCARQLRRGPPVAIAVSRCNRCGACLSLGCPAISDPGREAMAIDPGVCSGCGLCAPLCRARAIALP
jgi:TPP-dependent indolepyruvate ferredoxin oxidoreductase alpha subunit